MNKAFIFDFDGVIINNEPMWEERKKKAYPLLFGGEIYAKLGSTLGINMNDIYKRSLALGSKLPKEKFLEFFYKNAKDIYKTAPLTQGIEKLGKTLASLNYAMGVVSASPKEWIEIGINRLPFKKDIKVILSLYDRPDLLPKPNPNGYSETIKELGSTPTLTLILEDSNPGIASAKAAGAYTIGLKQNLVESYPQKGADIYAESLEEVINIVKDFPKDKKKLSD